MSLVRQPPEAPQAVPQAPQSNWFSDLGELASAKNVLAFLGFCVILQSIMLWLYQCGIMAKIRRRCRETPGRRSRHRDDEESLLSR